MSSLAFAIVDYHKSLGACNEEDISLEDVMIFSASDKMPPLGFPHKSTP